MSRILLLGSRGRLGAALVRNWSDVHDVTALARPELDAADLPALANILEHSDFDVLVNATGATNVDRCETERAEAETVNTLAPELMASAAAAKHARLIHFSTDYVFDGTKHTPYDEDDPAHPLGHYGATKLAGEQAVLSASPDHLVVRVSWVFGPDKPSFVDTLIDRAITNPRVEAVADKTSCPTFSEDVADWLSPFLSGLGGGLFHACNAGACTWQDYGRHALACAAKAGVPLKTTEVEPILLSDLKAFVAPRPPHTVLSTKKLSSAIAASPRPWQDALEDYLTKKYSHAPIFPSAS